MRVRFGEHVVEGHEGDFVEIAGRPLATGAVIPRPAPGGAIYVKGRSAKIPYARAVGGARCKVY